MGEKIEGGIGNEEEAVEGMMEIRGGTKNTKGNVPKGNQNFIKKQHVLSFLQVCFYRSSDVG